MARSKVETASIGVTHDDVINYYRERLAAPAELPWANNQWPPVCLGPTWQVDRDGQWILPEATLGWDALGWAGTWLQHRKDEPWRYTLEQARWLLWWYEVNESGEFTSRDAILQRLKGWGKDPVGATLCAIEAFGPCRFLDWDGDHPIAIDVEDAWVQTAAVALDQTKNTMRLFPSLFTAEAKKHFRIQVGKEQVYGLGDTRLIQALTSSPATLQGARSTLVLLNETHEWNASNGGHDMAGVIDDNATKSPDGAARTVRITNAYNPADDSVAQRDRDAWELARTGGSLTTGIMYDSLEAHPKAPLTAEAAPEVVAAIRGDSVWLKPTRIVDRILDTRNPPSRSRRFWYNQITAAEDSWTAPEDFDACVDTSKIIYDQEEVVAFFDGSKSDDATGLVACRMSDGHDLTLNMWQKPPGERGKNWTVPRLEVDAAVDAMFERFNVIAFFGDPSHTLDDVTQERYWDGMIDAWHRRYKNRLKHWAKPGKGGHSVMWDMASPAHTAEFTAAAERCADDIKGRLLTHDGDGRLRIHVHNARRAPNRFGVSLSKENRESKRKIDLAVCMVGARMVRRSVLNAEPEKKRSGVVW